MPAKLTPYEKAILADTFGRSPMLQESIKSGLAKIEIERNKSGVPDDLIVLDHSGFKLLIECIGILSTRSGMRLDFIRDNINEISEL